MPARPIFPCVKSGPAGYPSPWCDEPSVDRLERSIVHDFSGGGTHGVAMTHKLTVAGLIDGKRVAGCKSSARRPWEIGSRVCLASKFGAR
jgi:hypothetical protein